MRALKSLRSKFVRTMLLVAGIVGISTLAIVVVLSAQASSQHLSSVRTYIEQGIPSKGMVLTQNHALALEVRSTLGVGTRFSMRFPWSRDESAQRTRGPLPTDPNRAPLRRE